MLMVFVFDVRGNILNKSIFFFGECVKSLTDRVLKEIVFYYLFL